MENMKNLCAPIPEALHTQVMQEKERLGQTLGEYRSEEHTSELQSRIFI